MARAARAASRPAHHPPSLARYPDHPRVKRHRRWNRARACRPARCFGACAQPIFHGWSVSSAAQSRKLDRKRPESILMSLTCSVGRFPAEAAILRSSSWHIEMLSGAGVEPRDR